MQIYIRDDDVIQLSTKFRKYHELMVSNNIPINYAVIPYHITQRTIDFLNKEMKKHPITVSQHGYKQVKDTIEPTLAHRDFHQDNLLWGDKLYIIDLGGVCGFDFYILLIPFAFRSTSNRSFLVESWSPFK